MTDYSAPMTVAVNAARGALAAHQESRAAETAARERRDAAIQELHAAGATVPDIDKALGKALSRSMIRWILGHA